jgi:hypothetical protein
MTTTIHTDEHICAQNTNNSEILYETNYFENFYAGPCITFIEATKNGRFEYMERINFCPYCGIDLRIAGIHDGTTE